MVRQFNYKKYSPYGYSPVDLKPNDKLMLFVRAKDAVKSITSILMSLISKTLNTQLNIYLIGNHITRTMIEAGSNNQNIIPNLVQACGITLNFSGNKQDFDHGITVFSALILKRTGKYTKINLNGF